MSETLRQSHNEFARRAELYSVLDARFSDHTRFFAAAAWTNCVLSEVSSHWHVRLFLSFETLNDLCRLGTVLERLNLRWARRMSISAFHGQDLDGTLLPHDPGGGSIFARAEDQPVSA